MYTLVKPCRLVSAVAVGVLLVLAGGWMAGQVAWAHGPEVKITVSSFPPDAADPLTRIFRVVVTYADGEPIEGARVVLETARRGGGPLVKAVNLAPLSDPGVYVGQVVFPLYGTWEMQLSVQGTGEGEVGFIEELMPAGPASGPAGIQEARKQVLDLFFRFSYRDVANIVVRLLHTIGGFVVYGLTVVILIVHLLLSGASRAMFFRRLSKVFLPAVAASMLMLALSGVYSAAYGAPIKAPGIFNLSVMWQIPYGPAYLGAIAFKVVAFLVSGALMLKMAKAMKAAGDALPASAGGSRAATLEAATEIGGAVDARPSPLLRLAVLNAVLGMSLAIAIVVAMYLHNLSHLAVFLPE